MKTTKTLKGLSVIFLLAILASCQKEEYNTLSDNNENYSSYEIDKSQESYCGERTEVNLFAGQNIDAGKLVIQNNEEKLYVTYVTENNWKIGKIQLFVGNLNSVPVNKKGNPQVGLFPYKISFSELTNYYTFEFNLSDFDNCFIVAAHAEVHLLSNNGDIINSETAWGEGIKFVNQGNWATYTNYCKQECQNCDYTIQNFDLFGGQNILVGNLQVTNDETNLYISYSTTGGWFLSQLHLYVGDYNGLPKKEFTPVPGLFPYSQTFNNYTTNTYQFTIPLSELSSCYIIAAHASVVYAPYGKPDRSETAWSYGTSFPNTSRWGWYSEYCTQICN